ncbi:MAG: replication initiator protein A, partial [Pseudomonadota bacterium]
GDVEELDGFGLIDRYKIVRETREGRMQELEITLSEWVSNAIYATEVLTLSRNYFRLRKPLERRLYELVRKQCGQKAEWRIGLEKLKEKCGSNSTDKEFRRLVRKIIEDDREHDHLPDYRFELEADIFIAQPKDEFTAAYASEAANDTPAPLLKMETYDKAKIEAPGWDIYYLETEWRAWMTEPPRSADAAFIGFCRKWFERRGRPT